MAICFCFVLGCVFFFFGGGRGCGGGSNTSFGKSVSLNIVWYFSGGGGGSNTIQEITLQAANRPCCFFCCIFVFLSNTLLTHKYEGNIMEKNKYASAIYSLFLTQHDFSTFLAFYIIGVHIHVLISICIIIISWKYKSIKHRSKVFIIKILKLQFNF